jgi:diguanylate cyclase (GGDEF)-like protein
MPGLDGFETARRMKEDERGRRVPIIFLTGLAERSEIARGYSAGAVDYVLKPFEPEILRSKVQVFVDLFELRQRAALMTHRALHDQLTGLPNRTLFLDRLEMALARIGRTGKKLAVLFLDLDGFKHINDTLGHPAGDQMLIETAVALQQAIRAVDTAARFGGDEFVVLCEDIADAGEADAVAGRIFAQLERRTPPGGTRLRASIGIAVTGRPERAPEELIREADAAMLEAKSGPASR